VNVQQLYVKRLREMLSAVRHARHAAHASRTHLARAVRVAHSGTVRVNKAWRRLDYLQTNVEKLPTANLEGLTVDPAPLKEWQQELAVCLQEFDEICTKELAKAKRAAAVAKPRKRR
jgi:hypothetical protein